MSIAVGVLGQTGSGDSQFISRAAITLERNDRQCADANGGVVQLNWIPMDLSEKQVGEVRQVLLDALKVNKADEREAKRHGQVTGGVPGCVSFDFRLTFQLKDVSQKADLHLCAGWIKGDSKIGSIVLSDKQKARLQKVLGEPCR